MRYSEKGNWLLISMPKVASQTLYRVLHDLFPDIVAHGMHTVQVPARWLKSLKRRPTVWTTIRNPYSRAISQWWHSVGSHSVRPNGKPHLVELPVGTSFPDYVRWLTGDPPDKDCLGPARHHVSRQSRRIKLMEEKVKLTHFVRQESLEAEFNQLPFIQALGRGHIELPRVNSRLWHAHLGHTQPPDRSKLFTPELANLVYEWERPIFERFGYDIDSWKDIS